MQKNKLIDNFFSAIDDIETFDDGSIIIKWKANVSHEVSGHYITNSSGSNIINGHQIHMNPDLSAPLTQIDFYNLQSELNDAVILGQKIDTES